MCVHNARSDILEDVVSGAQKIERAFLYLSSKLKHYNILIAVIVYIYILLLCSSILDVSDQNMQCMKKGVL